MVKIEIMIFNIKLYQHLYTDCRRLGQDGSTEIVCIYLDKNKENTESDFFYTNSVRNAQVPIYAEQQ